MTHQTHAESQPPHLQPLPYNASPLDRERPSGRRSHPTDLVAFSVGIVFLLSAVAGILIRSMGLLWSDGSTIGWMVGGSILTLAGAVTILGLLRKPARSVPITENEIADELADKAV